MHGLLFSNQSLILKVLPTLSPKMLGERKKKKQQKNRQGKVPIYFDSRAFQSFVLTALP